MLVPLLLSLSLNGEAALGHASRLAALGPHPWGSALSRGAAQYVESQFRAAGLSDVRLSEFERGGLAGVNVVGRRAAPGASFLVLAAHHDSAPGAPGAYDDGGGVGILIEIARVLAAEKAPTRSIVFVSFDGEEGWSRDLPLAGSRAFVEALGARSRDVTAMITVEMSGWKGGTPCVHAIAYADPLQPGETQIAPSWLVRTALAGGQAAVPETRLGDPLLSWLYQPLVRAARIRHYGDDRSFQERGIPSLMVSDSSFSKFYPWYHSAEDTADKIDAASLARTGNAVLGMTRALERAAPARAQADWFCAFGQVLERTMLLILGFASLVPLLLAARRGGTFVLTLRTLAAAGFGLLLWRAPVPVLFCFGLSNLLAPFSARRWVRLLALLPLLAVIALAIAAWQRGFVGGIWLTTWELAVAGSVTAIALIPPTRGGGRSSAAPRKSGGGRRRGLPKK